MPEHTFAVADRVYVVDVGLERLRQVMRDATGQDPQPNHHGIVAEVWTDSLLINFDAGGCAPYAIADCRPLILCASTHHRVPVEVTNWTDRCDSCWADAAIEMEAQRG